MFNTETNQSADPLQYGKKPMFDQYISHYSISGTPNTGEITISFPRSNKTRFDKFLKGFLKRNS